MWPSDALPAAAATTVDPEQFLAESQLSTWHRELDAMGMRATGSPAHECYIDLVQDRLGRVGVSQVHSESVPIDRWSTETWSLEILSGPDPGPVHTASYIPYSGSTTSVGATGELVLVDASGASRRPAPGSLLGKIAVFDMPFSPVAHSTMALVAYDTYDPSGELDPMGLYDRPWSGVGALIEFLDALGDSGALGAVAIIDLPAAGAYGSYFPYDGIVRSVPGLFVDAAVGRQLKALAAAGTLALLTLPATVERTTTRNVIGMIPGRSDEVTILNSHTDGTNGIEDNGPDGIIAMCQYLNRLPRNELARTVAVVMTTGHFHGGIGQIGFVESHLDTTLRQAACGLCLEHLGALEWQADENFEMSLTGRHELGVVFVPENAALVDASKRALRQAEAGPAMVLHPYVASAESPSGFGWPGEGTSLWTKGRLPTANYITGPTYLLNWGTPTEPKCDVARMRRELIAFTQMTLDLGRVPFEQLRALDLKGL